MSTKIKSARVWNLIKNFEETVESFIVTINVEVERKDDLS